MRAIIDPTGQQSKYFFFYFYGIIFTNKAKVTDGVQIVMVMNHSIRFEFLTQLMTWKEEYYKLRVDSFATYPYSCCICLLEFSLFFTLKTIKIPVVKCDSYTRMFLQRSASEPPRKLLVSLHWFSLLSVDSHRLNMKQHERHIGTSVAGQLNFVFIFSLLYKALRSTRIASFVHKIGLQKLAWEPGNEGYTDDLSC